jgi:hypothetical protein
MDMNEKALALCEKHNIDPDDLVAEMSWYENQGGGWERIPRLIETGEWDGMCVQVIREGSRMGTSVVGESSGPAAVRAAVNGRLFLTTK